MSKKLLSEQEKKTFIEMLTTMSDTEINEFIKTNGKNNSKEDSLFVFQWDNLKKGNEYK